MFTMYRLILAVITLFNLSSIPCASAADYIQYEDLFGRGVEFRPFSQPSYQTQSAQTNYVYYLDQFTLHPHYFQAQHGKKRLIVLDNDGVLLSGSDDYSLARAQRLLTALAADRNNEVWVNSARSLSGLGEYRDIPWLNIAAEHGTVLLVTTPNGRKVTLTAQHHEAGSVRQAVKNEAGAVGMRLFEGQNSIAYAYKSPLRNDVKRMETRMQQYLASYYQNWILRLEGDKNYGEFKHRYPDKGNFVIYLLRTGRYNVGLSMGDQESDEGMFEAMIQAQREGLGTFYPVVVSSNTHQLTTAPHKLQNPDEVHQFFRTLGYA
ncbi:hypothetical protein PGT21_006621 [Puccinia graminis f. sp. tritici]|uniref:Trehalose-phosphatase n=1 Tax=Puccinia graminis f. sp. tritici TaxID=56615 RepID=A0A5B0PN82_PUCGR|nr:hypothetical protein PGT21_006621 [Puccinia graminis f. sp. tritici]